MDFDGSDFGDVEDLCGLARKPVEQCRQCVTLPNVCELNSVALDTETGVVVEPSRSRRG